jgi:Skp family chaperone for outer membrane proteins
MRQLCNLEKNWPVLLATLFVCAGASATEKAYISVDESGQTVISDTPPTTGTLQEVKMLPKQPQADATKANEEVQRIKETADQMAAERKQKQREQAAAKAQKKRQQQACAAARSRLEQLKSQPPNRRLVIDPDGTARRVSAQEMESLVEAAEHQVAEDCGALDAPATSTGNQSSVSRRGEVR